MRIDNISLPDALGATTNYVSPAISLRHIAMYAVQLSYSASAATIKLQASCDDGHTTGQTVSTDSAGVTNWTDIADTSTAITGAGSTMWNMQDCGYRWFRIVSTGTATFTAAQVNLKGV